jgi:purine-nucleoside phosphorylase
MEPSYAKRVNEAVSFLRGKTAITPSVMIVLGSGLSDFVDKIEEKVEISSAEVPHFPPSKVEGHKGQLVFGKIANVPLLIQQGRFHYYEGHPIQEVAFPVHVANAMGAKTLIVTNAAGGINTTFVPGDIMLIEDHINFMGTNPLLGMSVYNPKNQFPDMTGIYTKSLRNSAERLATELNIPLKKGVFMAVSGPSYETRSEIRTFRSWGVDAIGMSTVPEVIVAGFYKMSVLGFSCIANIGADLHQGAMSHAEVLKAMEIVQPRLAKLLLGIIPRFSSSSGS